MASPCKRATWRGVVVCAHTVPKLDKWAVSVGSGILLKPLAGCGSYQTSTVASAGTHAGGGAIDIDLRAVSSTKRKWVADLGRTSGLQVAWHRNYVSGLWTWHAHSLDPACPNLASAAVSQIVEFTKGGDGLVGSTPDGNTRSNLPELVKIFTLRLVATVGTVTEDATVRLLQQAVRRPVNGIWDIQTDIDLRNTRSEAYDKQFDGDYFKKWSLTQRKRMQMTWGTTQDGVWGPATAAACKASTISIQKALGVVADGIWGPVTDKAYVALRTKKYTRYDLWKPYGSFPYPGGSGTYYGPSTAGKPWYSGKVGSSTASVSTIRSQIAKIQRMVGTTADGLYGSATASKVKAWQKAHKLTADGIVGPATWSAMVKANHDA